MHSIYRVLLFITYFGIIIHCKRFRISPIRVGDYRSCGCFTGSSSSCTTFECLGEAFSYAQYALYGGIVVIGALCCCVLCCGGYRRSGLPDHNNPAFIQLSTSNEEKDQIYDINAFQSGTWSSRYYQDNIWHGPHEFSLSFDPESMRVTGAGSDDVGAFTIDGIYSITTHRMGLTKTYQKSTANPAENSAHEMIIQLTWNELKHQFEGRWYVRTKQYKNGGVFELKFIEELQPFRFENDNNEQVLLHNYV